MSKAVGANGVEAAISGLQKLGRKKPLGGEEMVRVKDDMRTLKENGFTNSEISTLSNY